MDNSSLVSQVFKARKTLLEQLGDQGFDVSKYEFASITEIHAMLRNNQLDFTLEKENGQKVVVIFHIAKALRPANLADYVEQYFDVEQILTPQDSMFIVTNNEPNDTLLKTLNLLWQRDDKRRFVSVNTLQRLQFNILSHQKVPKHIVLSEEEANSTMNRYGIVRPEQIPSISRFDPAAVAVGLRPGQLCRIERTSPTAINSVYYRMCLSS
jgi:DNA-directed RNA polymerase subunit H